MSSIANNIATVEARIRQAENHAHRPHGSVLLLAVAKTKPAQCIRDAVAVGISDIGENYVQEALEKMSVLSDLPITWHYIGHVQTNKTRLLAEHFAWVHTVDRLKVAQRLNDQRPAHLPPLNICLEVNIDDEASKSGVSLAQLPELAQAISLLPRITLRGLMAIPKPAHTFEQQQKPFLLLADAFEKLRQRLPTLDTLSMGMSADLEAAIASGSTLVRVGTDIFGARETAA